MIAADACALIVLAAGRSTRFGAADKLRQPLWGMPLGLHVAAALAEVPFAARFAVTAGPALDFAAHGYRELHNDDPAAGLSGSIRLGIAAARALECAAAVIALADMPRVSAAHVRRLLDAGDGPDTVVASSNGAIVTPPALFGAGRFAALLSLTGDEGARALIRAGRHVIAPEGELLDIDRSEDLERLRAAGMVQRT